MTTECRGTHMTEIAEQVREAREKCGWTQNTLASHAGVSRPSIARIERGDDISTSTLTKVVSALGLALTVIPDMTFDNSPA